MKTSKWLLMAFICVLLLVGVASAETVIEERLKVGSSTSNFAGAAGTYISSEFTTSGNIVSEAIDISKAVAGDDLALVTEVTTSSNITITWQYSYDGVTFYTVANTSKADQTATISGLTESDYIYITDQIAKFVRFTFTWGGSSTLTKATLLYKRKD